MGCGWCRSALLAFRYGRRRVRCDRYDGLDCGDLDRATDPATARDKGAPATLERANHDLDAVLVSQHDHTTWTGVDSPEQILGGIGWHPP